MAAASLSGSSAGRRRVKGVMSQLSGLLQLSSDGLSNGRHGLNADVLAALMCNQADMLTEDSIDNGAAIFCH